MKLTSSKVVALLLCLISISSFMTAQETAVGGYGHVYVINLSSYHARVFIDGYDRGSVWCGATLKLVVVNGEHTISAQEYENASITWGPSPLSVYDDEWEWTLNNPSIPEEEYTTQFSNLYVINSTGYDIRIFVDGHEKGTALAGGTFTTTLQGGYSYELYGEEYQKGEIWWGPESIYLEKGEDYEWTLTP